jgi:hypothetical protein
MNHRGIQTGVFERAEGKGAGPQAPVPIDSLFTPFPVFVFTHGIIFNTVLKPYKPQDVSCFRRVPSLFHGTRQAAPGIE